MRPESGRLKNAPLLIVSFRNKVSVDERGAMEHGLKELHLRSPSGETVTANYSKLSDHIRRLTPQGIQCSVFCGGTNCKYESPESWKADSLAIQGIYSHWITDEILAMARPSTNIIIQKNIIQQFESLGIKSIINLQSPKEHASCGQPLESSGFSYEPNIFMEHNIYYYNFAWKDYGDAKIVQLLNMVKVLAFAVTEGRVAIHCHAGLGRTGVLIACYLVYSLRVSANDAIRYVRLKRRGSVQTRGQILSVRHFAQFILPQTITYYLKENINKHKFMNPFGLNRFLKRQRVILHGYEERNFKHLPKIIHCICERILKLCGCWIDEFPSSNIPFTVDFLYTKLNGNMPARAESTYSLCSQADSMFSSELRSPSEDMSPTATSPNPSENGDQISDSFSELSTLDGEEMSQELLIENRCFQELETQKGYNHELNEKAMVIQDLQIAIDALLTDYGQLNNGLRKKILLYQIEINNSQMGWIKLNFESDLKVLAMLLFEWIEALKFPVIKRELFESIVVLYKRPEVCFEKFAMEDALLIEYLLRFISKIQPVSKECQENLLKRVVAACSKQSIVVNKRIIPSEKGFKKFREGTLNCTMQFFWSLLELVETHHSVKSGVYLVDENKSMYAESSSSENDFQ